MATANDHLDFAQAAAEFVDDFCQLMERGVSLQKTYSDKGLTFANPPAGVVEDGIIVNHNLDAAMLVNMMFGFEQLDKFINNKRGDAQWTPEAADYYGNFVKLARARRRR